MCVHYPSTGGCPVLLMYCWAQFQGCRPGVFVFENLKEAQTYTVPHATLMILIALSSLPPVSHLVSQALRCVTVDLFSSSHPFGQWRSFFELIACNALDLRLN